MKLIYFHTRGSRYSKSLLDLIEKYCLQHEIDYTTYNTDEDADVMSDYNVGGNPPAYIVMSDSGKRIALHKGRFTEDDLKRDLR